MDVIFNVKEKRTGNVNFGASVGGPRRWRVHRLDQPNLFGRCKRGRCSGSLAARNDFNLSYSDPSLRQTRISGTVQRTGHRSDIRADLGRSLRTGGSVEIGSRSALAVLAASLLVWCRGRVRIARGCSVQQSSLYGDNSFRSTFGHDRNARHAIVMPFPTAGGMQSLSAQFSGGPLGGNYNFQQYRAETRAYAPLGQIGGKAAGVSHEVRVGAHQPRGRGHRQHGSVLLLAGVRARRRSVRRAAPRLRRVLDLASWLRLGTDNFNARARRSARRSSRRPPSWASA